MTKCYILARLSRSRVPLILRNLLHCSGMIPEKSMVKITLRCEPTDYFNKADEFRNKFQSVMPEGSEDPPATISEFAYFLQRMLQISAEQALPASVTPCVFQPVASFYYADGVEYYPYRARMAPD